MRFDRLACAVILVGFAPGITLVDAQDSQLHSQTETTPQQYCQLFSKVRDNLSRSFGSNIDPLTRLEGIEVICDHKAMVFRQDVQLRSSDINADWVARRTQHWSKTYCGRHPAFAGAIRNGWTISTVLSLADGQALRIDAACHDAEV